MSADKFRDELRSLQDNPDEDEWHRRLFLAYFARAKPVDDLITRITAVAETRNPAAGVLLRSLLYQSDPRVSRTAARGLADLGGEANEAALASACASSRPSALDVVRLLADRPSERNMAALRDAALRNPKQEVVDAALAGLEQGLKDSVSGEAAARALQRLAAAPGPTGERARTLLAEAGRSPAPEPQPARGPLSEIQAQALSAMPTLPLSRLGPVTTAREPLHADELPAEEAVVFELETVTGETDEDEEEAVPDDDRAERFGSLVAHGQEIAAGDPREAMRLLRSARDLYPGERIDNLEAWIGYVEKLLAERRTRAASMVRDARQLAGREPQRAFEILQAARRLDPDYSPEKIDRWMHQIQTAVERRRAQPATDEALLETISLSDRETSPAAAATRPAPPDQRKVRDAVARLQHDPELPRSVTRQLDQVRDLLEMPRPTGALLAAYEEGDSLLHQMVSRAVLESGEAPLELLKALLLSGSPAGRRAGVEGLAARPEPEASELLVRIARQPDAAAARLAMTALAARQDPPAARAIEALLAEPGPVRLAMLTALQPAGKPRLRGLAAGLLDDRDPQVAAAAAACLAPPLDGPTVEALIDLSRRIGGAELEPVVRALGRSDNVLARPRLVELASAAGTEAVGLQALGDLLGEQVSHEVLQRCRQSGLNEARLSFLGRHGGPDAARLLIDELRSGTTPRPLLPALQAALRQIMTRVPLEIDWDAVRPGGDGDRALRAVLDFRAGRINAVDLAAALEEAGAPLEPRLGPDIFVDVRPALADIPSAQKGEALRGALLGGHGKALVHLLRSIQPADRELAGLVTDLVRWSGEAFASNADLLDQVDLAAALVLEHLDCRDPQPFAAIFSRRQSAGYRRAVPVAAGALARLGQPPPSTELAEALMALDTDIAGPLFVALAVAGDPAGLVHLIHVLKSPRTLEDPDRDKLYAWTVDLLKVWAVRSRIAVPV